MSAVTNSNSAHTSIRDPSTFLQRPSSAKTPDVSHILTNLFGEIYTKDLISTDVIKNLTVSFDVDNEYHKRYVERLKQAQIIKENRIQEYAMLEKHILEARAKALAFEEREFEKRKKLAENPDAFGVPPVKSYFSYCLDDSLLKEHGLLVPSDYYYQIKQPIVPIPKNDSPNRHLKETFSFKQRSQLLSPKVLPPINSARLDINQIEELHKAGSEASDFDIQEDYESSNDEEEKEEGQLEPFWKKTLRQEERMIDKIRLQRLEDKIKFLPNPRLDAERSGKNAENVPVVFEATPKYILFNKYIIGKVYESSFEIRNTSLVAHQFRALPPKTQYFSLSLGQYPQGQSVIAPGLGAIFNVRFAPDSLGTFEDEISIECSNGSQLIIPIIAKRESPSLSIGPVINCGQALVGQIKVCRFIIKNKGGDGRFVIFSKSAWPVSTFKTNLSSSILNLYPFEIQPSIFELHKGDFFMLEVIFKPPDTKKYEQEILITCDNCTTIEFKLIGEGELAEIEYIQQDSDDMAQELKENILPIDDFKDRLSTRIIRFPPLNPNVFTRKRFAIKNKSSSSIDYSWIIYKPVFDETISSTEFVNKSVNYVIDKESLFTVAPKQGTLDRNEVKTFELMFSSIKTGSYCSVAHLVLHNIPEVNKQLMLEPNSVRKTNLTKEDANTCDFVANVIELRGECEPFQFTLDPPAIFVPGATYMHSTVRKSFRLINMSICPINFNWKQVLESSVIQVEPSYGEIASKSYALMDVLITGTKPGKIVEDIPCYVEYADEPVYLHVEADIKGPEAVVQEAGVDFGLVQVGDVSKTFVTIHNISNLDCSWKLSCLDNQESFGFEREGYLQPLETRKLNIIFAPSDELIINTQFKLEIENGNLTYFNCYAQSQRPRASFLKSEVTLAELYLNVSHLTKATLCNHSFLEAQFKLGQPEGNDSKHVALRIEPQNGIIRGKSLLEFDITIKSSKIGELSDLRIPCYVSEMSMPIFLNIVGKVHGVSVDYFLSSDSDFDYRAQSNQLKENSIIEFDSVKVGECSIKYIFLKNKSGIDTKAKLNVKRFKTINIETKNTNSFIDPMNKLKRFGENFKLIDSKNGIGFGVESEEIFLPAFSTVSLALCAKAELWGHYKDDLFIEIDGISDISTFKMDVNISGSPIKLYAGKVTENETDQISMIRFGSQMQGTGLITRKLKLQNTSSIPIEINWKIFLNEPNDNRLIDLNLVYQDVEESSIVLANHNQCDSNSKTNQAQSTTSSSDYSDSDYIYFERIPIVKISLTKHYGRELFDQDNEIYLLNNRQFHLKPRETINIDVMFNSDVSESGIYDAIFIGYLNLANNFMNGEGFERKVGFGKEPIKFKATGKLDCPNLVVELDENLNFDVALGDLINNQKNNCLKGLMKEISLSNKFSLLNSTFAPIELDLETKEPFYVGNFSTKTQRYLLKPKTKLKVDLLFKFEKKFSDTLDLRNSNPFIIDDYIKINYSKGLHQLIPFSAKIHAPEIIATRKFIDFGTCLVGQERCQQFAIRNPSSSSLLWNIEIVNNAFEVFRCEITNGFMEASKIFVNKTEQIINVYFNAKHSEYYDSKIVFSIEPYYGAPSLVIGLRGNGSFDQKHEAFFNI